MYHIFTPIELKEFVSVLLLKHKDFEDDNEYINDLFNDSISWQRKLISFNHFLSIVIEQLEKRGIDCSNLVQSIYSQVDTCHFEIQEGDIRFLESLFKNDFGSSLTLEEELIEAQNRIEK
ncbi:hypothetical protein [Winogradskyella psychrotolerans]|uniref:hypothetical protein n=1 Tax=Winogradskyella psychrotolerans TaxID=1344585 RepID=UPI001C072F12|nr:hypothetical protein [Winogradskyella psychrotolerans]MBU2929275.1 hypothetical protein [Winogradskyella psychrotolerans]